ncbi:MAG TPA: alpha/beta fold hydrolase [Bryobacteraceae bacterium]|nr:alpha/beta fold hydrolase [Bryobacteraceae bacterium]
MTSNSTRFLWKVLLPMLALAGMAAGQTGTVEKIKVHGTSLEGNLEGDPAERDVFVYLPPSYATQPNRRYPVVYFIHGYGATAEAYWKLMTVPATADKLMSSATVHEMILVHPDAHTLYDGSMYSDSPTTGNWEGYITHDLVAYIDGHYRTIANPESRGLAGHSMGGYGTLRLAMKYPGLYSSIYAMSSCCLMNNPGAAPAPPPSAQASANRAPAESPQAARAQGVFRNVRSAQAAAWSPNPKNPPKFFDLPVEDGTVHPEIVAKWIANSPLAFVDQYAPNLKKYHAIRMDVGDKDNLAATNKLMDEALTRLGVTHTFEVYEGTHGNRVKERFETQILPFFSENLSSGAGQGSR